MRTTVGVNPAALIFGSDLPSTRAAIPFQHSDIDRIADAVGTERSSDVLAANARKFYRLTP